MTVTRTAAGEFKVLLRGPDNDIDLALEPDVDAPTMFFFDRLLDTIKFVKEQQGRDLWYFSFDDDRGWVSTRLDSVKVYQQGQDKSDEFRQLISSRTAAEPGGVLPWTPSDNGYYWIAKSDGTLEAVTNDGVNRMYVRDKGYGYEWEVHDNQGLVEKGNFGSGLRDDALRDRADDLLAEFDTAAQRRTRGPSRGYEDDYTQAPHELWGKREALHHDPSNDNGIAIVLTFPAEYRESLAHPDGTPPEELHITLGYFGKVEDQDPGLEDDLRVSCEQTASWMDPFIVTFGGLIRFSGVPQDAFVLSADSPNIEFIRSVLLGWLDHFQRTPDDTHGFTPHCTLGYLDITEPLPFERWNPVEIPVTALELWYGGEKQVFPLGITDPVPTFQTTSQKYAEQLRQRGRR